MKLTSPDHISSIYQLMLLIFKVSYHYHWSFQNVSFWLMEKLTVVDRRFFVKKFLDSITGAFIIVFPYFKNSYRPATDMTCFTDIYVRVKTEYKLGIRYFVICTKADWWHRLNLFKIFEIELVSLQQCLEIQEMSLFSKLILLTNLEYLSDIFMCFFLGKFISEIHEYSQNLRNPVQVCE